MELLWERNKGIEKIYEIVIYKIGFVSVSIPVVIIRNYSNDAI